MIKIPQPGYLLITGEKPARKQLANTKFHLQESSTRYGTFCRKVKIPDTVKQEDLHISIKDGIAEVHNPRQTVFHFQHNLYFRLFSMIIPILALKNLLNCIWQMSQSLHHFSKPFYNTSTLELPISRNKLKKNYLQKKRRKFLVQTQTNKKPMQILGPTWFVAIGKSIRPCPPWTTNCISYWKTNCS